MKMTPVLVPYIVLGLLVADASALAWWRRSLNARDVFVPQRVDIPLKYDENGRYVAAASMVSSLDFWVISRFSHIHPTGYAEFQFRTYNRDRVELRCCCWLSGMRGCHHVSISTLHILASILKCAPLKVQPICLIVGANHRSGDCSLLQRHPPSFDDQRELYNANQ